MKYKFQGKRIQKLKALVRRIRDIFLSRTPICSQDIFYDYVSFHAEIIINGLNRLAWATDGHMGIHGVNTSIGQLYTLNNRN